MTRLMITATLGVRREGLREGGTRGRLLARGVTAARMVLALYREDSRPSLDRQDSDSWRGLFVDVPDWISHSPKAVRSPPTPGGEWWASG